MKVISSRSVWGGTEVSFLTPGGEVFSYVFSRICVGLVYPKRGDSLTRGYACVVGERLFRGLGRVSMSYMVVDEAESIVLHDLFEQVLKFKDEYTVNTVYAPKSPANMLQAMMNYEGIAWYSPGRHPTECQRLWPSFRSKDNVAGIRGIDVEDSSTIFSDLDALTSGLVMDPNTDGLPVMDAKMRPLNRLVAPVGFNNERARNALSSSSERINRAMWIAVSRISKTPQIIFEARDERTVDPVTGY